MRSAPLFFSVFFIIVSYQLSAKSVTIRKILDSNLFEIEGGQKIQLAYIDVPSVMDPNPKNRSYARFVQRYAKAKLLNKSVEIEYIVSVEDATDVRLVCMWKKYPMQTVDVIKDYLENGFGKLLQQTGLPVEEAYFAAAQKAKSGHRGVWNPNFYNIAPQNIFTTYLILGYGNDNDGSPYNEIMLNTKLFANDSEFGIQLLRMYGEYSLEYSKPQDGVLNYVISLYSGFYGKNIGFEPGFFYIHIPYERRHRNFALPNARLKIGDLDKAYFSLDFLTDFYSPFSIGINVVSNDNWYYKFWFGITPLSLISSEDRWMAAVKSEFAISKNLLFNIQGLMVDDRYDPTRYGFRAGIGFQFPVSTRNPDFNHN